MKGTLQRTEKGWQISYEVINSFRIISVHPDEAKNLDADAGGEVHFERELHEDGRMYAVIYPNDLDVEAEELITEKEYMEAQKIVDAYKEQLRVAEAMNNKLREERQREREANCGEHYYIEVSKWGNMSCQFCGKDLD